MSPTISGGEFEQMVVLFIEMEKTGEKQVLRVENQDFSFQKD